MKKGTCAEKNLFTCPFYFFRFKSASDFYYFTLATIALNASGWFTAKSANTLRLISIPALCKAPINLE